MAQTETIEGETMVYDDEGRTKIPIEIVRRFGIEEGQGIDWVAKNGCVMLTPADDE